MTRIGLLSDTHGFLDPAIPGYFAHCDEIWHAGDFGSDNVAEELKNIKPLRGVYGNIDGTSVRKIFPEHQRFACEKVDVWMTHIGGSPGKYPTEILKKLVHSPPRLFICGHSHILVVKHVAKYNMLHMNPGAAGKFGQQKVRTLLRFVIDGERIQNLEVIELQKR